MKKIQFMAEVHSAMVMAFGGGPDDGSWVLSIRDEDNGLFVEIVMRPEQFAKILGNRNVTKVRGTFFSEGVPKAPRKP